MRVLLLTMMYPLLSASSLVDPFYGIINYTFISVIRPEQLTWGIGSVKAVFVIAISFLLVSCLIRRENVLGAAKEPFFRCFILFTAALYFSTVTSTFTVFGAPRGSFYYLNQLLQILCFCLCLYGVLTRVGYQGFERYLTLTLLFFLVMGIWGIDQYRGGNADVEGLFGYDRCAVTSVFVMYFPVALHFVKKDKAAMKLLGSVALCVFLLVILFTQSRAGFLGTILAVAAMFCCSRQKKIFLGRLLLLLVVGALFAPASYFQRYKQIEVQNIEGDEVSDYSSGSRQLMWKIALDMIPDRPLFGVGHLNFQQANREYAARVKGNVDDRLFTTAFGGAGQGGLSHTHNTFLNVLVEGGLVAAIPFFLLFLIPLWKGFKLNSSMEEDESLRLLNLINCGLAGFLVTAFFGNLLLVDFFYWNLTVSYFLLVQLKNSVGTKSGELLTEPTTASVMLR